MLPALSFLSLITTDEALPTLDDLASTWQTVRVCNAHGIIEPCHGKIGIWTTEKLCIDAGCCWNGSKCFAPNAQRSPADAGVAYFAANQQAPSLSNGVGMLMAVKSGDPLGISCITLPPYAGECQTHDAFGGLSITCNRTSERLSLNHESMNQKFQWFPYQILRSATISTQGNYDININTTVRMPFQRRSVLLDATIQVTGTAASSVKPSFKLNVDILPVISDFAKGVTWGWTVPRPRSSKSFNMQKVACGPQNRTCFLTKDDSSDAVTAVTFAPSYLPSTVDGHSATWNMDGLSSARLQIVLTIGNNSETLLNRAASIADSFDAQFASAKSDWETWWQLAFTPPEHRAAEHARHAAAGTTSESGKSRKVSFGGNLPTLVSPDKKLMRTYYMGCVSLLLNSHFDPDASDITLFGSAGPISAVTAMYIWDTTLNAVLFSLLEPDFLRNFILKWTGPQLHRNYAVDYVSGDFVGPWYAFNDWQLSRAIHTLAQFSDGDVLYDAKSRDNNNSVAEFVEAMATFWQTRTTLTTPNQRQKHISTCENLTGVWYGEWRGHSPELDKPTHIVESANHTLHATYNAADGWGHGNGTVEGMVVAIDVYEGDNLHAKLRGTLSASCTKIEWDNDSLWCRNGSSPSCQTAPPNPADRLLADYGGASNLLECVPTYTHKVPSLNAANVWLMRQAADMIERKGGNLTRAAELRQLASMLSPVVRERLYVKGKGFWRCEKPSGELVEVRHIIDFTTTSLALGTDLSSTTALEMVDFVQRELKTQYWLRALSLHDGAAPNSDRKDHGPYGSYDGWMGETLSALATLGRYDLALELVQAMAAVYDRGPGGQSHQVFTVGDSDTIDLPAKAAADQQYFALSGAVIANAIITDLFGVDPGAGHNATDSPDPSTIVKHPASPRGFEGTLKHIRLRGSLYTLQSNSTGVHAISE